MPRELAVRLRKAVAWLLPMALLFVAPTTAQLLPRLPRDTRPEKARTAFEGGRYEEAAQILEGYLRRDPENAESWLYLGWSRYRLGEFSLATQHFQRSLEIDPQSIDALVGLGYASLQTEGPEPAARIFLQALERDETRGDALRGLVLTGRRADAPGWVIRQGLAAARKLEQIEGKDVETIISSETLRAGREKRLRPPADPNTPLSIPWRAGRNYLLRHDPNDSWRPVYVKGINLSPSLPGRFPSDYPTEESVYSDWLERIADLGANTVRVYNLLPPGFYRALGRYNQQHEERPLWLLHGIWTETVEDQDLDDPQFRAESHAEIARVIDAVHGNLAMGPRAGKAWGSFDQDVSQWLVAFVVGRNWEPFVVQRYNEDHDEESWSGEWLEVQHGRAMEILLARLCDHAVGYEATHYRTLHPVSFANWPSLDPLHHPTESTRSEENRWRAKAGLRPIPDNPDALEDDAVSLDATLIRATAKNPAGLFASYQIFPSFPDFMSHEYARDQREQRSAYESYLADLKAYHGEQPVLVIEYGISTSRGIAHVQAEGRHHGGHDELEQGRLLATMTNEIRRQAYAGGVIFSFMDEWSRSTWNTTAFEIPAESAPLWLNAQSPDQFLGLMRMAPASARIAIDGENRDWSGIPAYATDKDD